MILLQKKQTRSQSHQIISMIKMMIMDLYHSHYILNAQVTITITIHHHQIIIIQVIILVIAHLHHTTNDLMIVTCIILETKEITQERKIMLISMQIVFLLILCLTHFSQLSLALDLLH